MSQSSQPLLARKRSRTQSTQLGGCIAPSKRPAPAAAVLGCALSLPTLGSTIPREKVLAGSGVSLTANQPICHIARIGGADSSCPDLDGLPLGEAITTAAVHAVVIAIACKSSHYELKIWPDRKALAQYEDKPNYCNLDGEYDDNYSDGSNAMVVEVVEFDPPKRRTKRTVQSGVEELEAAIPGFSKVLYAVMEKVSSTCIPVITPITLFCETFYNLTPTQQISDYEFISELQKEYGEQEEFAARHQLTLGMQPQRWIEAYQSEVDSVLPSTMHQAFGQELGYGGWQEANQGRTWRHNLAPEICNLMEQAALRHWCEHTNGAVAALATLHSINAKLDAGACFASGSDHVETLWRDVLTVYPLSQNKLFTRVYDDVTRSAHENGGYDCLGTFHFTCQDAAQAAQQLNQLRNGSLVVMATIQLLRDLGNYQ
jgi:hypothetical protein